LPIFILERHEICPDYKPAGKGGKAPDKVLDVRRKFRSATGDIDCFEPDPGCEVNDILHGFDSHYLTALRPGFKMAVPARKIANVPDVHLQGVGPVPRQLKAVKGQSLVEWLKAGIEGGHLIPS
jgi:hypothetical protein